MDGAVDRLTLIVLAEQQPRAKMRHQLGRIECAGCVKHHRTVSLDRGEWRLDDRPGPQGTCYNCGLPLRRVRLNPV